MAGTGRVDGKATRGVPRAQEAGMNTSASMDMRPIQARRCDSLNYVAADPMPRDQAQSRRLHEPTQRITSIDPITGCDIQDLSARPYLVDGNVVMYFESEQTRQAYLDTPLDHPLRLPDNPTEEGVAERFKKFVPTDVAWAEAKPLVYSTDS